jgi:2'-5' RNA ligase
MEKQERIIGYWICPAEPARSRLVEVIGDLARQFDAPVFEPHVTIYVTDAQRENPAAVLGEVLRKRRDPFRLTIRGLDYSAKFTKALFVQFAPDPKLTRLSEDLRRASGTRNDYELNPHVSLIYKKMDEEMKGRLANSITLPFTEVTFDNVKAIISPAEIKSREEVEAWRIVAEQNLAS